MSIYSVEHDKNIVHFTHNENGRTYALNVNTGEFYNVSTNKLIKAFPAGFGKFLDNYHGDDLIIRFMYAVRHNPREYNIHIDGYTLSSASAFLNLAKWFNLVDRAQNVGCKPDSSWCEFRTEYMEEANNNFKEFANYCRTTDIPTFYDFYKENGKARFAAKFDAEKYHLNNDMVEMLYSSKDQFTEEQMRYAFYYVGRGLYEFIGHGAITKLREFFNLCDKMGVKPPKEDFYRSYINYKREYEMNKSKFDAEVLRRVYANRKNALSFERGRYMVVIPQTVEEFKAEADAQHNCVYSMYLQRVLNGDTHVVFVRDKANPNKSLVTCEVREGRIIQFLKVYNSRLNMDTDAELCRFQADYALHLASRWH